MIDTRAAIICGITDSYVKSFILRIANPTEKSQHDTELNCNEYHEFKIDQFGTITKSEAPDFSLHLMKICDPSCKLDKLNLLYPGVLIFLLTPTIIPQDQNDKLFNNPTKDEDLSYQRNFFDKLILENHDFFEKYAETIINVIPYKTNECGSMEQFLIQVRKFQNEIAISMSRQNANRNVVLLASDHFDSIQSAIKFQLVPEIISHQYGFIEP